MSRKCKCKICNKELTTDKAYKITRINNKTNKKTNMYYCSKEEYDNYIKDKEDKIDCISYIVDLLKLDFNLPVLKKELKEIEDKYNYIIIKRAFEYSRDTIEWFLGRNEDCNDFNKIRYSITVVKGNIRKVAKEYEKEMKDKEALFKKEDDFDIDIMNNIDNENNKKNNNNIHDISSFLD